MKRFFKKNWVDLLIVLALLFAVWLLLNRNRIGSMRRAGQGVVGQVTSWFGELIQTVTGYFNRMSSSEMLAWLVIVVGGLLILWRIRYRFLKSDFWQVTVCPKCAGDLRRVHRTTMDRIFGPLFLPHAARYRCSNPDCGWSGLRQQRQHAASTLQSQNSPRNHSEGS